MWYQNHSLDTQTCMNVYCKHTTYFLSFSATYVAVFREGYKKDGYIEILQNISMYPSFAMHLPEETFGRTQWCVCVKYMCTCVLLLFLISRLVAESAFGCGSFETERLLLSRDDFEAGHKKPLPCVRTWAL